MLHIKRRGRPFKNNKHSIPYFYWASSLFHAMLYQTFKRTLESICSHYEVQLYNSKQRPPHWSLVGPMISVNGLNRLPVRRSVQAASWSYMFSLTGLYVILTYCRGHRQLIFLWGHQWFTTAHSLKHAGMKLVYFSYTKPNIIKEECTFAPEQKPSAWQWPSLS